MKRLIKYILLMGFVAAFSVGCDEDSTGDISKVTYYPEFELNGENPLFIDLNSDVSSYEDPGAVVTEGGEEIDYDTQESVDVTTAGYYDVVYSATNQDGYSASAERTVIVGTEADLSTNLTATGDAVSSHGYTYSVSISKVGIGKFHISDINGFFSIPIPGEVGILNEQVVTGSASYGMYKTASLDLDNNQLIIEWTYYQYSGTTTIPVSFE